MLSELRQRLLAAPERFTPEHLETAHQHHYHIALVDIISMVKHAADEGEPLLTADERLDRALHTVTGGRYFDADQRRWLERIRDHLVQNLTIDRDDFNSVPVFSRFGGWGRANRAFHGELPRLLSTINEAIAA